MNGSGRWMSVLDDDLISSQPEAQCRAANANQLGNCGLVNSEFSVALDFDALDRDVHVFGLMGHRDDDHAVEGDFGAADAVAHDGLALLDFAEEAREQNQDTKKDADDDDSDKKTAFEQESEGEVGGHKSAD